MRVAAMVFAAIVSVTTVLPLLPFRQWWIRIFDFPRIQIAALSLAGLLLIWLAGSRGSADWLVAITLGVCLVWQAALMLPYTPLWRCQVKDARSSDPSATVSLLMCNVLMTNRNAAGFLDVVADHNPDIVVAVETDRWWQEQLSPLTKRLPHTVAVPLENTYGMLLFSRFELLNSETRFVIEPDVPSIHTRFYLPSGQQVELHCLHPRPPVPQEAEKSAPRDAELLVVGAEVKKSPLPCIVTGDLNDVAWSRTTKMFQKISSLLDPRIGRGFYNTFHAQFPLLRFSLDHLFHSNEFRVRMLQVLPGIGSDHFPFFVSLSFEPDAVVEQPEPVPDPEAHQEKEEAVQEAEETG